MNKFYLLRLFPTGNFCSGNEVMAEVLTENKTNAISFFQKQFPLLNLDAEGYCKCGQETFCMAEDAIQKY